MSIRVSNRQGLILLLVGLLAMNGVARAAQTPSTERLEYTFSYRGIFSGFLSMRIAKAIFILQPDGGRFAGRETRLAAMQVTTEPFGKAEMIYPIRYSYRSWLDREWRPLLVNEHLETDEVSEELLWFDREGARVCRYVKRPDPVAAVASLPPRELLEQAGIASQQGRFMEKAGQQPLAEDTPVWDYLSMLFYLRRAKLQAGSRLQLPVFNGKRFKHFQVEVTRERLQAGGWDRPAYRLDLSEKGRKRGIKTSIWISDDAQRVPLRFYAKRAFGAFDGVLDPDPAGSGDLSEAARESLKLVF